MNRIKTEDSAIVQFAIRAIPPIEPMFLQSVRRLISWRTKHARIVSVAIDLKLCLGHVYLQSLGIGDSMNIMVDESLTFVKGFKYIIPFGADPTATADSKRMAAGQTEYFTVAPGDKVAVITNT